MDVAAKAIFAQFISTKTRLYKFHLLFNYFVLKEASIKNTFVGTFYLRHTHTHSLSFSLLSPRRKKIFTYQDSSSINDKIKAKAQ